MAYSQVHMHPAIRQADILHYSELSIPTLAAGRATVLIIQRVYIYFCGGGCHEISL